MWELIWNYISNNYAFILFCASLIYVCSIQNNVDKRTNKWMRICIISLFVYSICVNLEAHLYHGFVYTYTPTTIFVRKTLSIICYVFRAGIVLLLLNMVYGNISKKLNIILQISLGICALLYCTAYFYKDGPALVFTIDSENDFIAGPLSWIAFLFAGFYAVVLLYLTFKKFKKQNKSEAILIISELLACLVGAIVEMNMNESIMLPYVLISALAFYYLYLHIQMTKVDTLTGLLNRKSFFDDIDRYSKDITGVISIDMNNLKELNDTKGHHEGDIALRKLGAILESLSCKKCRMYRIGGDEFEILQINQDEQHIKDLIERINQEIKHKQANSVAIGYSYRASNQVNDIEYHINKADASMYENKKEMKESNK